MCTARPLVGKALPVPAATASMLSQVQLSITLYHPHRKERKRKDYAFWRQLHEKPNIVPGCQGNHPQTLAVAQTDMLWSLCAGAAGITFVSHHLHLTCVMSKQIKLHQIGPPTEPQDGDLKCQPHNI